MKLKRFLLRYYPPGIVGAPSDGRFWGSLVGSSGAGPGSLAGVAVFAPLDIEISLWKGFFGDLETSRSPQHVDHFPVGSFHTNLFGRSGSYELC